jgi:hypothetical protein
MIIIITNIVFLSFPDFDAKKSIPLKELENINMKEHIIITNPRGYLDQYEYSEKKLIKKNENFLIKNVNILPERDTYAENIFLCKVKHLEKNEYEILDWKYILPIKRESLYILPKKYKCYFERFIEKFSEH